MTNLTETEFKSLKQRGVKLFAKIIQPLNAISNEFIRTGEDAWRRQEDYSELCVALALLETIKKDTSMPTYPKLNIKPINPEKPISGRNCEVLLDGKPLPGLTRVVLDVGASDVGKVYLEMLAPVTAEGLIEEMSITQEPASRES